jgi:hypothetical protein
MLDNDAGSQGVMTVDPKQDFGRDFDKELTRLLEADDRERVYRVRALVADGTLGQEAGAKARELLENRIKNNRRKKIKRVFFWFFFIVFVFGGLAGFGYWASTQVIKSRTTVSKTCSTPFGKDGTITGTREYSYLTHSLFGYEMVDKSQVEEKTKVDIRGNKIDIIGLQGGKYAWRRNVGEGERYDQLLRDADTYIFFDDKATAAIPYSEFCK